VLEGTKVDSHVFEMYYYLAIMFFRFKHHGYVYLDIAGDIHTRRSTTWNVFSLGSTKVSCILKLQKVVVVSTMQ
jgi:hypothetical protein